MTVYTLSISTFMGLAPGASHYWGRITRNKRDRGNKWWEVNLQPAARVRKKYGDTTKFDTQTGVVRAARRWFRENAKEGDVLLKGSSGVADPQEVLAGPPKYVKRMRELYVLFEKMNGYECSPEHAEAVDAIQKEWDALIK